VTLLDVTNGKDAPTYRVRISPDFNAWDVTACNSEAANDPEQMNGAAWKAIQT
jgi:hypothetical protein